MDDGDTLIYGNATRISDWDFTSIVHFFRGKTLAGICSDVTINDEWDRSQKLSVMPAISLTELLEQTVCANRGLEAAFCVDEGKSRQVHRGNWLSLVKSNGTVNFVRRWLELAYSVDFLMQVPRQEQDAMTIAAFEGGVPCTSVDAITAAVPHSEPKQSSFPDREPKHKKPSSTSVPVEEKQQKEERMQQQQKKEGQQKLKLVSLARTWGLCILVGALYVAASAAAFMLGSSYKGGWRPWKAAASTTTAATSSG